MHFELSTEVSVEIVPNWNTNFYLRSGAFIGEM